MPRSLKPEQGLCHLSICGERVELDNDALWHPAAQRNEAHWALWNCWSTFHKDFPPQSPAASTIKTFKSHFKPQMAKTHSSLPLGKGWLANLLTETTSCQGHQIGPGGQLHSENPLRLRRSQRERLPALPVLKLASFCSQILGVQEVRGNCGGSHRSTQE